MHGEPVHGEPPGRSMGGRPTQTNMLSCARHTRTSQRGNPPARTPWARRSRGCLTAPHAPGERGAKVGGEGGRRRRRRRRRLRHRFLSRPPSQRTRAIHEGCCGRLREDANCGDASRAPPPFGVGARRAKRGGGEAYRGRVGCVARRAARPWQAASPIPLHSVSGGMSTASR